MEEPNFPDRPNDMETEDGPEDINSVTGEDADPPEETGNPPADEDEIARAVEEQEESEAAEASEQEGEDS